MPQKNYIVPLCLEQVELLYADSDLLVVEKPAGLLSVPGRDPANHDCVVSRVQEDHPSAQIVHRLDFSTSGLMVLALNRESHRALSKQFEQRTVGKQYEAILYGDLATERGSWNQSMRCDWPRRPLQMIDEVQGKPALTHFEVTERWPDCSRTRVTLKPYTGRSHQLRLHSAAVGHPILGCEFYAHGEAQRMAERLLLHASTLSFKHPCGGEGLCFKSRIPF